MTRAALATVPALLLAALVLPPAPAAAQVRVEKRRPAPAAGEISIENDFGSTVVTAWDQAEVLVRGTLAAGAEGLDFDGDDEDVWISVEVPEHWFHASDDDTPYRSRLEVFAPRGASVWVDSVNADVRVSGFRGAVDVETINGAVFVDGPVRAVEVETMTGTVDVDAAGAAMEVDTISGAVRLAGARGEVSVETVSGSVSVSGEDISSLEVESISGEVSFTGSLAAEGGVEIETFSGPVTLVLPADVRARFELESFSGEITSEIAPDTPEIRERFVPIRRRRFSTGLEELEVRVSTHDAPIVVRAGGGGD